MKLSDIPKMKDDAVRDYLTQLVTALDELDMDDYFGTEGWRHVIMQEDEQ